MTFIPYGKQNITQEDIDEVIKALRSDFLTQGPLVERFENELANYLGCKHVVVVSNGTAALHIASLALGLKPGDAVIVPAISFVATSNSVLYCGATPVFADVDPITGNISIQSAEEAYYLASKNGLIVKAIYPVHYSGYPCNPKEILDFAKKFNLKIVEDSCHALGAKYRISETDDFSMTGSYADMAVWSFHPVKHITTGEGGAVSTNDPELAKKLKLLRSHGITKSPSEFSNKELAVSPSGEVNPWYYEMQCLGFNYRLPDILCALGLSQLNRLNNFIERRKCVAKYYSKSLSDLTFLKLPSFNSVNSISSYHLFPILLDFDSIKTPKSKIINKLKSINIGTQVHYLPIPMQPYYQSNPSLHLSVSIKNSIKFYEAELSIPMYYDLNDYQLENVVNALTSVLKSGYD